MLLQRLRYSEACYYQYHDDLKFDLIVSLKHCTWHDTQKTDYNKSLQYVHSIWTRLIQDPN